jgi:amino acid adenylation domain-containing protein
MQMIADSVPVLVLSTVALRPRLPQTVKVLGLDTPEVHAVLDQTPARNPTDADRICSLSPDHPAYVIYTSGSTGTPKGVVVTQQNVVRLFGATQLWFNFGSQDVWVLFHSYAFDFSVWELWGALLYGGRLVVPSRIVTRSPTEFLQLLAQQRVTVLNQTPSAFYQLLQVAGENPALTNGLSLRYVIFGGEALDPARLEQWYRSQPPNGPLLVNMYGITETTVHVSYLALDAELSRTARGTLIGGNIPDLRVYVLDAGLELVPAGVSGELYVAGAGVARGYLARPRLTAERFVADPRGQSRNAHAAPGIWRVAANGVLEFLGRADQQVKIRGFRNEPGEIEAALLAHPAVTQAALLTREQSGAKQLVAYIVAPTGASPRDLRSWAETKFPDYMVPAHFVLLDRLPLTVHGKLDRNALPGVTEGGSETLQEYAAPVTETERQLAEIWRRVLGVERVGAEDNFFELGGDSLLTLQLVAEARAVKIAFSIRDFYEARTIRALERKLETGRRIAEPVGHTAPSVWCLPRTGRRWRSVSRTPIRSRDCKRACSTTVNSIPRRRFFMTFFRSTFACHSMRRLAGGDALHGGGASNPAHLVPLGRP